MREERCGKRERERERECVCVCEQVVGGRFVFNSSSRRQPSRPYALYKALTDEYYRQFRDATKHEFVFMDVAIDGKNAGKLVFEVGAVECAERTLGKISPNNLQSFLRLAAVY